MQTERRDDGPTPEWPQDRIDDEMLSDDDGFEDEDDNSAECGRWDNGRLVHQCRLAGTEWCDWDCPIGLTRAPTA